MWYKILRRPHPAKRIGQIIGSQINTNVERRCSKLGPNKRDLYGENKKDLYGENRTGSHDKNRFYLYGKNKRDLNAR